VNKKRTIIVIQSVIFVTRCHEAFHYLFYRCGADGQLLARTVWHCVSLSWRQTACQHSDSSWIMQAGRSGSTPSPSRGPQFVSLYQHFFSFFLKTYTDHEKSEVTHKHTQHTVRLLNIRYTSVSIYVHYRSKVWGHPDNFVSSMKTHFYLSNELKI